MVEWELRDDSLGNTAYSHFRLVRTRLTHNFGLHTQKSLVQSQIALTHILNGLGKHVVG